MNKTVKTSLIIIGVLGLIIIIILVVGANKNPKVPDLPDNQLYNYCYNKKNCKGICIKHPSEKQILCPPNSQLNNYKYGCNVDNNCQAYSIQ